MGVLSAHVALLRGINVGGKNKLAMKDLVAIVADAGGRDVRTYVQSGNVVFAATAALAPRVAGGIERAIAERHGLRVPVVLRSAEEMAEIAAACPFLARGASADALHVVFLASDPGARAASLDPDRSPGDSFVVRGREIYLHCPNGIGRSKLTNAWLDAKLATTSTMRNWRTVLALVDLTGVSSPAGGCRA